MTGYRAGEVSAKITLDTKEFKAALDSLKTDVSKLKGEFNSIKGVGEFTKQLDELKDKVKSLSNANEDYRKQLKKLREESNNVAKNSKKTSESLKKEVSEYQDATEAIKEFSNAKKLWIKDFDYFRKNTFNGKNIVDTFNTIKKATDETRAGFKSVETEAGKALAKTKELKNAMGEPTNQFGGKKSVDGIKADTFFNADWEKVGYLLSGNLKDADKLKIAILGLGQALKQYNQEHNRFEEGVNEFIKKIDAESKAIRNTANAVKYVDDNFKINAETLRTVGRLLSQTRLDWLNLYKDTNQYATKFFHEQNAGMSTYKQRIAETSAELRKFYLAHERYYASVGAMSWKYWRQIRNSTVENPKDRLTGELFPQSTFNAQTVGLQDYYANITKISEAMAKLNNAPNSQAFKEQLVLLAEALKTTSAEMNRFATESDKIVNSMSRMAKANEVAAQISKISKELNHFSGISSKNKTALSGLSQQITILKDKFRVLDAAYREGEISAETYDKELTKLAEKLKLVGSAAQQSIRELSLSSTELSKTGTNARNAGRGITSFNNGVVQTAHSGRILSNTLYQIRGALLSVKMIATAMGGMALWGFAMEIAEGVKTTFTAKNEMEAQLKQNAKVGASGLREFNKELDNTAKTFQKINKYQLGETVSSLGVEFDLGMRQMKKAMPIVAMIQSEYVRAGRTSEEAALAVKDILQGEFQRLSRETGVGKDELTKYGWSGDKTDIDSLLDAVKKAGEDRHWDVFAQKATSLNDVIEITKNRFEEFGADFLQTISPMIVSGFNTVIGFIDKLHKAFEGMGSFGKNALIGGGFIAGIAAITTALPMVTKGMGLAEIATLGWGKSLGTAALNLNKAEVAQYGFKKALSAVISGTSAAELSEVRWTKAIMGRILGVNQGILAQRGYRSAIFNTSMAMREGIDLSKTSVNLGKASVINLKTMTTAEMGRAQKLAYLTNNIKLNEAAEMSRGKAILKTVTSVKLLRVAFLSLMAIGVVAWFASIAQWADTVRARVDLFNDYVDNGKQKIKDAKKTVSDYNKALSKMGSDDPNYAQTKANQKTAEQNLKSTEAANKLAKQIKKDSEETAKNYDMQYSRGLNDIYKDNGLKDAEKLGEDYLQMKMAAYDIAHAEEEREKFQYASLQHIAEHASLMKEAGVSEEKRLKYITEYSAKSKEAAENLKKFNEGDLTAGVYYVINRLQLMWIDLWNDTHFVKFWESVKKTWEDLQPTINQLVKSLGDLGHIMLDFFSTEQGQFVGGAIAIGAVIAGIGYKIAPTIKKLKDFGSTLADVLGKVKDWKRESGSDTSPTDDKDTTSTGGINGDIEGKGSGSLKTDLGNIFKNRAKSFANNALLLAEGMALMTEAILLLNAPMLALAGTGALFKSVEPQVRAGIEGLKLIAPVVLALLAPTVALMTIMGYFHVQTSTLLEGFKSAAVGVALGIVLVTEAIVLLNAPLIGLAILGSVYGGVQESAQQGIKAMQVIGDALKELVIWIPVFAAGIALAAITIGSGGVGGIAIVAAATGIAIGIGLVTEAIMLLCIPLEAVAEIGANFPDLSNAQQGAEAMKVTAEALKYVEQGVASLVTVQWDILKSNLASLLGVDMGTALDDLVKDDGFLPKLSKFAEKFNGLEFTPINQDKATALSNTANGITAVNDAMKAVKTAMENLPEEFKKGGNGNPSISYDPETDSTSIVGSATDTEGYFDTLIEPLKQLKDFIDKFNNSPELDFGEGIDTSKVAAIQTASDMIVQIKSAVDNVKQTMGMIADAGWEQNMASGGIGAAVMGWISGLAPGGATAEGYSSSLGSSLKEMENVVKDIITFSNNINTLVSGGNGDGNGTDSGGAVNAMANMVTAVDQAIQTLTTTLQNAVPTAKSAAQGIGTGIREGIQTGIGDLTNITVQPLVNALNSAKAYGHTYGQGVGYQTTQGYKTGLTIKSTTETEIGNTLTYLDGKKQEFYDKGHALGEAVSNGYKDGDDMHSPGIIARSTFQELGYVATYFDDAMGYIPEKAYALAELMSSNFQPSLAMGGLSVDDLSAFESGLNTITYMANDTDMQTSMAFNNMNMTTSTTMGNMTTTVNGAFTNIDQNATTSYGRIVNTTRTSLKNMQDQTTKNITAIKTSWRGMQTALIASAEQIRSETSAKITQLEHNMGSFWNKVNNPSLLLGGGSVAGRSAIRRSRGNTLIMPGTGTRARLGAGGAKHTIQRRRAAGGRDANMYSLNVKGDVEEYLKCLMNGGSCIAGGSGWHFDWTDEIRQALLKWNTHFGDSPVPYDSHLTVGKFENDDFPVRGIAEIAKQYIFNAISQTTYDKYFDSKYGSPLAAWNAGSFNCVDGALVAIAFANAFGFPGGYVAYSSWNGIGHGFAVIPGLGIIDATAIQNRGSFTAPDAVSYPAAGSHTIPQSRPLSNVPNVGTTINIGDINVHIEGDVENAEEKGKQIGDEINNRIYKMLRRSPSTGQ